MIALRMRFPPTFSSAAVGFQHINPFPTTMAGRRSEMPTHRTTTPEKGELLIEEGFSDFAPHTAPPP
jgi:hypothetical protein